MIWSIRYWDIWTSVKFREGLVKSITYIVLCAGAFVILLPFLWMVSTSLKPHDQVYTFPIEWIPRPIMWGNYLRAWRSLPTAAFFKNSGMYATSVTIGSLVSCSLVAYGFARLRFRGRNILFFVLLATMMLPYQVTMIPLYIMFSRIGWVNSYKPLVVPAYFGNAYYIFLLRQFFMTIPKEMDDSAKIDGCGIFNIYLRIILPLSKPALGIIAIFSFTSTWNNFMSPLIYLNDLFKYPISLGLRAFQTVLVIEWQSLMAMSLLALLPVLLLFFIAQRYYIQGIVLTGVKG
ncbi:MAG: carbohydrate ABC transporter permease [bacterium]